jgi:hypothetical protein
MWQQEMGDGNRALIARESSSGGTQISLEPMSSIATFRDPHPAFPAAMGAELAVTWAGGDEAR